MPADYPLGLNEIPSAEYLLPFSVLGDFSDHEIIEIVDFIRADKTLDKRLPIMFITKERDAIKVQTGTQEAPLSGSGEIIYLQKENNRFKVKKIFFWIS